MTAFALVLSVFSYPIYYSGSDFPCVAGRRFNDVGSEAEYLLFCMFGSLIRLSLPCCTSRIFLILFDLPRSFAFLLSCGRSADSCPLFSAFLFLRIFIPVPPRSLHHLALCVTPSFFPLLPFFFARILRRERPALRPDNRRLFLSPPL